MSNNSSAPVERNLRENRPKPGALFNGYPDERRPRPTNKKPKKPPPDLESEPAYPPGFILSTVPNSRRIPRLVSSPIPRLPRTPSPDKLSPFLERFDRSRTNPLFEKFRQTVPLGQTLFPMADQENNNQGGNAGQAAGQPNLAPVNNFVNQLSAQTQAEIAGKKLPAPGSKDAPRFKDGGIREYFMGLEWLFSVNRINNAEVQIEISGVYVDYDIRRQWVALPEYSSGNWLTYKKAVLKLYNKGEQDQEYTMRDVEELLTHYKARPIGSKGRMMEFRREVVHKLQYLIDIGDVTQKSVLDLVQQCFVGPAWAAIYNDLRAIPVPPNRPLGQRWTLSEVITVAEKYLEEIETFGGAPMRTGNTYERELISPSTTRVKIEDMHDQVASINSLADTLKAIEKARQDEMRELEKVRQEESRRLMAMMDRMGTRQVQMQSYPTEHMGAYVQQNTSYQAPRPPPQPVPKGILPVPANFNPSRARSLSGKCYFCDEHGHFLTECPEKNKFEKEGWIYKPGNSNWYFTADGISLSKRKDGMSPMEQVLKYIREHGPSPPANAQNYEGLFQEDFFAPTEQIDRTVFLQQQMVDPAYLQEGFN